MSFSEVAVSKLVVLDRDPVAEYLGERVAKAGCYPFLELLVSQERVIMLVIRRL